MKRCSKNRVEKRGGRGEGDGGGEKRKKSGEARRGEKEFWEEERGEDLRKKSCQGKHSSIGI